MAIDGRDLDSFIGSLIASSSIDSSPRHRVSETADHKRLTSHLLFSTCEIEPSSLDSRLVSTLSHAA
jgi:hypothetical protein